MAQISLRELLETRITVALDADPSGRVLLASNESGTMQLYELEQGRQRRLTDLPEPVSGRYLPGSRSVLLEMDSGGNERHRLYRLDLDGPDDSPARPDSSPRLTSLTQDPALIHHLAGISQDGRQLAYTTNRRNGIDFDVWLRDLSSGEERPLFEEGGWCHGAGFSPDGRWLAAVRPGKSPKAEELLLIEVASGKVLRPLPDSAEDTAGEPGWLPDSSGGYLATNFGSDLDRIVRFSISDQSWQPVLGEDHDLDCVGSPDGSLLAVVANIDGSSDLRLHQGSDLGLLGTVQLPEAGVVAGPRTPSPVPAHDGSAVYFTFSSPRMAGDVFMVGRAGGAATRLTTSSGSELAEQLVLPTQHRVPSFDGEQIPVSLYRPPGAAAGLPAMLLIHGGPESQSKNDFNPVVQALVARGYTVAVPNVRGSTGYGRRYYSLDDTVHRLDSVADMAAVHRWLPSMGVDQRRVGLWGGSYGGYMVLAGLAFQPELWAAAVDIVGISDLVTFLENTSSYRRVYREREYGSLAQDREFLERASPLRQVEAIRAPLFIIHGKNDPRVPLGEAEQMAASLKSREIPCELHVYPDEGHGLAKLANRLDAYPKAFDFLDRYLRPS